MLSTADLAKERRRRKNRERNEAARRKQQQEANHQRMLEQYKKLAQELVDGEELDKLITKADTNGIATIRLDQYKVWYWDIKFDEFREFYDAKFELGFPPDPTYEASKILIDALRVAGYAAKIEIKHERNCRYFTTADGYDCEYTGGTHPVYFLMISWK